MKLQTTVYAVLSALALMSSQAQAQALYPYVDNYQNNEGVLLPDGSIQPGTRTNRAVNPSLALLKGYDTLWTPGSTWNNGSPTAAGLPVLRANQAYVVAATQNRSAAQAEYAYLIDRRHQSYSAIDGLGSFAAGYRNASCAFTTINSVGSQALIGRYDERGNGAGLQSSASVGQVVHLVNTMRGWGTSSNPSKEAFNSPRPWRLNDDFQVVQSGTESTGYYTSTLGDGSPNTAGTLTFYPNYNTNVQVLPELLAVRSTSPSSDGGFVSGHTNGAYLASFGMAYAMPEKFQALMLNASEMSDSRIVAGMHLPLDVVGGRMLATALSVGILSAERSRDGQGVYQDMAALKSAARAQGQAFISANTPAAERFADYDSTKLAQNRAHRELYTFRMTYGLPNTQAVGVAAVVPKGAEVLLETRLGYLSAEQRREVLRTTAIDSGGVLTDDQEGYGRLNLYAAADGYGRFDGAVIVTMNAERGGFEARDAWRNDIAGTGGLVKAGSGELGLTGRNSYSGGTQILGGTLVAASAQALGLGDVLVLPGAKLVNYAPAALQLAANFTIADGAFLELVLGQGSDGLQRGLMTIDGLALLDGTLQLTLLDGFTLSSTPTTLMRFGSHYGTFDAVQINGLSSNDYRIDYFADSLQITAVPEPQTWLMLLAGLGLVVTLAKRRRAG